MSGLIDHPIAETDAGNDFLRRQSSAGDGGDLARAGLTLHWIDSLGALIVTKSRAGFSRDSVGLLRRLVEAITAGEIEGLKYFVLDFAHVAAGDPAAPEGFEELVAANAELVLDAPVITVAWARSYMVGADLDFALYCSVLLAQKGARFSIDGDPMELFGLYAALARKIGFAKAERLFENAEILSAEDMRDLLLAREVVEAEDGLAPIERSLRLMARRFNASQAIFRAQRVAMPPLGGALRR